MFRKLIKEQHSLGEQLFIDMTGSIRQSLRKILLKEGSADKETVEQFFNRFEKENSNPQFLMSVSKFK